MAVAGTVARLSVCYGSVARLRGRGNKMVTRYFRGKQATLTFCHLPGRPPTTHTKHDTTTHPGTGAHQPHTYQPIAFARAANATCPKSGRGRHSFSAYRVNAWPDAPPALLLGAAHLPLSRASAKREFSDDESVCAHAHRLAHMVKWSEQSAGSHVPHNLELV